MKKILSLIIAIALFQTTNAQNIFKHTEKRNVAYGRFGIEPTYVFAAGYMHFFNLQKSDKNIVVFGEVSSPTRMFGTKNYEIKFGGIVNAIKHMSFGITYNLNFSTGHVETKNFHSQKYAFANKLLLGYFENRWYIAFAGEYEKIFANNITHTQYYRDFVFPEAKDGWYNGAGGNIQLGIETGFVIKKMVEVRIEIKVPKSEKFNSYNGSPANVNLTIGYRF